MRSHYLIIAFFLTNIPIVAQRARWDLKNVHEITAPLRRLPLADRKGITARLHLKSSDLRAERISTEPEDMFFVQDFGSDYCGAVGNCDFWIIDGRYNLILEGKAQWAGLLPKMHHGRHDVLTSLHDSATRSERTQWRFNGTRYKKFACADVDYTDDIGNFSKRPHITVIPCR